MPSLRAAFAATVLFVLKMKKTQSIEAFRTTQVRSGEHDGAQNTPRWRHSGSDAAKPQLNKAKASRLNLHRPR